jgi:hypothetical protein
MSVVYSIVSRIGRSISCVVILEQSPDADPDATNGHAGANIKDGDADTKVHVYDCLI